MENFIKKHENAIIITFWSVVAALILLWVLVNVPIERDFKYEMRGYVIDAEGNILDEFPITIEGTEYNFIIDRKGSRNLSWSGTKITEMDQDATFIKFTCEYPGKNEAFSDFVPLHWYPMLDSHARASLSYFNDKTGFVDHAGTLVLDTKNRTLLWYNTHLVENAFIIGVTAPDADPWTVLQTYSKFIRIPGLDTASNNS